MWSEKKWGHVWINAGHRFYQKAILNESLLVDHKKSEIKLLLTRLRISGMTTALRPILYPPDNYDNDNLICLTFTIIISSSLLTTALRPLLHPSGQSIVKVLAHSLASGIANIANVMVWKWKCFFSLIYGNYFVWIESRGTQQKIFWTNFPNGDLLPEMSLDAKKKITYYGCKIDCQNCSQLPHLQISYQNCQLCLCKSSGF